MKKTFSRNLFLAAAALSSALLSASASSAYDWERDDGGEPKIVCTAELKDPRHYNLTFSTTDSPAATILYNCIKATDFSVRSEWICNLSTGSAGKGYILNGDASGELPRGDGRDLCRTGYEKLHIWAQKKNP